MLFSILGLHQHRSVLSVLIRNRTSDVAENFGKYLSGAQRISQKKDFEVIPTVKMETRQPVKGPFRSEFPTICKS